jgi:hypothetical protein
MRYASITAGAALSLSIVAITSVSAAEEATAANCQSMEAQVRSVLDSSQGSSGQQDAIKERKAGHEYCARGFYKLGMEHFDHALKLLGSKA